MPFTGKDEAESHLLEEFDKESGHVDTVTGPPSRRFSIPKYSNPQFGIPRWSTVYLHFKHLLFFLLPSFIQHRIRPELVKAARLHPTGYLDGMRGLAALFVFFYHLSYSSHDVLTAYGADGENYEFLKLPFVRWFYTGPAMVAIFFVVSGYALSYKPVKLMRSKSWKELLHTLSSSVFRRAIRLYVPCVVSTLMIIFLVRIGAYELTREIANDEQRLTDGRETHQERFATLSEQLVEWGKMMWIFMHPWSFGTKDTDISIDRHLWTIPTEFRSSLVLYLTQLGLGRLKPNLRISCLISLIIWVWLKDRWEMILFYSGFLLAELDFRRMALAASMPILPSNGGSLSPRRTRLWTATYIIVFLIGLYLCGEPQLQVENSPGWATLYAWIPYWVEHKQRYWVSWGAILLVWSTSNYSLLQRIFTNAPVQYLGRISFSLYLMHGPVTHTVGYGAMDVLWRTLGEDTVGQKELGFCIAAIIDISTTIWIADIFMRAIDIPTVKFAKWLEEKVIVQLE